MISNYAPLSTLPYAAMPHISAGGRAYLPVDSKQVVYSHFQYVSGVPRNEDQNGVSIGKLKILNTLIDQLVKMRESERDNRLETGRSDESSLDMMIQYVNRKIHHELSLAKNTGYAAFRPEPAHLLDLTA
ncbi:MAG: hypothetical protein P1P65_07605 [Treponema sp.]